MRIYHHFEDDYDNELRLDNKHCAEDELRLMVDGREFYLTTETAAKLAETLEDWSR